MGLRGLCHDLGADTCLTTSSSCFCFSSWEGIMLGGKELGYLLQLSRATQCGQMYSYGVTWDGRTVVEPPGMEGLLWGHLG